MRWMWIDRIVELVPGERAAAIKHVSLAEDHLHDHFASTATRPACPVMPASLIVEGMAQTAGILVGHAQAFREKVILAKVSKATLELDAVPGDTLRYEASIRQLGQQGASTHGDVFLVDPVSGDARLAGEIDIVFSNIDRNMAGLEFPEENFVFGESFRTLLRMSGVEIPDA